MTEPTDAEFLKWIVENCKIIHWPGDGHYPIEHAPAAKKDGTWLLRAAMLKLPPYDKPLIPPQYS